MSEEREQRTNDLSIIPSARTADQGLDHCLHYRGADAIAYHLDLVPTSTVLEAIFLRKSHSTSQFVDLKHAQHWFFSRRHYKAEAIKRGEGAQRTVERLPSAAAVRAIVDDEEGAALSERGDAAFGPLYGRVRSLQDAQ